MRLKQIRKERGITQVELAKRSGVSRAVIALVECSARNLRVEAATRLAPHLGVNWWELFDNCDEEAAR